MSRNNTVSRPITASGQRVPPDTAEADNHAACRDATSSSSGSTPPFPIGGHVSSNHLVTRESHRPPGASMESFDPVSAVAGRGHWLLRDVYPRS